MRAKPRIYKVLIVTLSLLLILCFYINTNHFITGQEWKHRNGVSIGDWIEFDKTLYSLKGRTIYKNRTATGKIVFCFGKMLIIKEIETGEKGYYINKTNFKF